MVTLKTRTGVAPFGAIVTFRKNSRNGAGDIRSNIVGDDGQVYMTGLQQKRNHAGEMG